jgi:hypothetical protein
MTRGDGATSRQMQGAPFGAVYIWCNHHLDYPKALAASLGRADLQIVSPEWLRGERFRGLRFSGIVVDHAAELDVYERDALCHAMTRVERGVGQ